MSFHHLHIAHKCYICDRTYSIYYFVYHCYLCYMGGFSLFVNHDFNVMFIYFLRSPLCSTVPITFTWLAESLAGIQATVLMLCSVAKVDATERTRPPLFERLNTRCQQLFGETVEENIYAPANVTSNELLGLEYLFSQSTGESGPFSLSDISEDGPSPEEEVIQGWPVWPRWGRWGKPEWPRGR